jgi:CheY-like chemotaxis protein
MYESLLLTAIGAFVAILLLRSFMFRRSAGIRAAQEAERLAAEQAARQDAERLTAEDAARQEAERLAAEDAARQEDERRAAEQAEQLAAEEAARQEYERLVAEEAERREAKRLAAEDAARQEAERLAAEEAARQEAKRLAAQEAARQEAERLAAEEAAHQAAERLAAEEAARHEAERLAAEQAARQEAERLAAQEAARQETERLAAEEARSRALAAASGTVAKISKTPEQTVVMVADDSKVVRIKTGRLLTAHRFQVQMAEDGLDAASQIEESVPDVLLTDVDMPGLNGMQLVRKLRGNSRTAQLPIIMVTSDSEELLDEAMSAGVNVVLGKPYSEEQLIAHIEQLMIMNGQSGV